MQDRLEAELAGALVVIQAVAFERTFMISALNGDGVDEIVFAVRVPGRDHWYVTFGNYADFSEDPRLKAFKFEDGVYWGYADGARLCRLNLRTGRLKTVLEDPHGGIRDPQLSYDGKRILFAYRRGGEHPFHLYQMNIDGTGRISKWERKGQDHVLDIQAPPEVMRYMVFKGSVAVDGISLTVAGVKKGGFRIWIIPHTFEVTCLRERKVGDAVNLEADLIGKYVEKFVSARRS